MSADHDDHGHEHEHPPYQHHHFNDMTQQSQSTLLGIWLFMAQEILFFGGLFGAYTAYRTLYSDAYYAGAETLDVGWGLINTIVLIASSVTVVFAVDAARKENKKGIVTWLIATLVLGTLFLGVKTIEYGGKYSHGLIPGTENITGKPFDFNHYLDWKKKDKLLGEVDADGNPLPRNLIADGPMKGQSEFYKVAKVIRSKEKDRIKTLKDDIRIAKKADDKKRQASLQAQLASVDDGIKTSIAEERAVFEKKYHEYVSAKQAKLATYQENNVYNPAPYSPDFHGNTEIPKGLPLYFSLYFAMSGMHALHMVIGAGLLIWIVILALMGKFNRHYYPHVEYFGLYWHFVDIVWIFLFPLLYLI